MTFIPVEELPKKSIRSSEIRSEYHSYKREFERFMNMNVKIAKVVCNDGEYGGDYNISCVLSRAVAQLVLPIDVKVRSNEIYLVRRDI